MRDILRLMATLLILLRVAVWSFLIGTALYFSVIFYLRSLHRQRLEERWQTLSAPKPARREFVRRGMRLYDSSARARRLLAIYALPLAVIAFLIYLVNVN
ncbi:hypothetical protein CG51_19815 [Haematobacter missouriensis]|nr:hypothetical protein [Haematobacter missouriensis]KFI32796.1 hypothetical protein CG51_19815 [Haematobacter missouriensis]OWJ77445.1 hypothetical protein CDV53_05820 [Haematobacter missouriensis]